MEIKTQTGRTILFYQITESELRTLFYLGAVGALSFSCATSLAVIFLFASIVIDASSLSNAIDVGLILGFAAFIACGILAMIQGHDIVANLKKEHGCDDDDLPPAAP